jgi:hypothetical protein
MSNTNKINKKPVEKNKNTSKIYYDDEGKWDDDSRNGIGYKAKTSPPIKTFELNFRDRFYKKRFKMV